MSNKREPRFRSGFEKKVYEDALEKGANIEYESPSSRLNYTRVATYLPDFVINGRILVETKGRFTSSDRTKMLRVIRDNPEADIRLVFQRGNNRLTKSPNSKTYGEWADKHGFKWSIGGIPEEWMNE